MRLTKRLPRGSAILMVLLLIPVLVFLARALAWLSTSSQYRVQRYRQNLSNTYVMEAGLAHASTLLQEDATWVEGFDNEKLSRLGGEYTITFQDPEAIYVEGNSVNNLMGSEILDGPRGPDTVWPGMVELVIHSVEGNTEDTGIFLMQAIFDDEKDWALSAGRRILMNGNVDVQGVDNLFEWAPVDAGVHANLFSSSETAISWSPTASGDRATFSGKVTTPARHDEALSFAGTEGVDYSAREFEDGAGRLALTTPDIQQSVSNNSSAAPPPVSPFGTTTLTGQDYYSGSALDLQGDLVLDGGALYVEGDLSVNGSITGTGSIYVTGKTTFKGDAYIEAQADGVALYSEGSISMSGFSGVEFMERLSERNPGIISAFNRAKAELLESSDRTPDGVQRDHNNAAMGAIANVRTLVAGQVTAGNETSDFIVEQLGELYQVINESHADGTYGRAEMGRIYREVKYGLDKIGTGYYKGLLVSNSYIYTDTDVAVVGAAWATGTNDTDEPLQVGDETIQPGDVYLGKNTSLLLNKELVDDEESGSPARLAGLDMLSWR